MSYFRKNPRHTNFIDLKGFMIGSGTETISTFKVAIRTMGHPVELRIDV